MESAAGLYTGRFSAAEFRRVLRVPSVLLVFALDTCQASVNWSIAFWAPTYLTRYHIAPDADTAAIALLPAIVGFVLGALLGGVLIDRLRRSTERAAAWIALFAMSGGLVMALVVFNVFQLVPLMAAAFVLGVVAYILWADDVGFLLLAPVLLGTWLLVLSVRPPVALAVTLAASLVIWFAFYKLLRVPLPWGVLKSYAF